MMVAGRWAATTIRRRSAVAEGACSHRPVVDFCYRLMSSVRSEEKGVRERRWEGCLGCLGE